MESKSTLIPVDAQEFFKTIRADELEIYEQLIPLEEYALDEYGDLKFANGRPVVIRYNSPGKIVLSPTNRFYAQVDGKSNTLPSAIVDGYMDVFRLDEVLIDTDAILYTFNDPSYEGCVWLFENDKYLGMYGIRSSIANTIIGKRGVATKMVQSILSSTEKTVVVPWPLEGMWPVLRKLGFKEYNTEEDNEIGQFLGPYHASTSNYWLLERE